MVYEYAFELAITFSGFLGLLQASLMDYENGYVDVRVYWVSMALQGFWAAFLIYFGNFFVPVAMLVYGTALYASGRALERFGKWGNADTWALALLGTSSYSFGFSILLTLLVFGVPYAFYFGKIKGEEIKFVPAFAAAQLTLFIALLI